MLCILFINFKPLNMNQTVTNGICRTRLSFDTCVEIALLMENTQLEEKRQSSLAYFLLVDYKQDLLDNESYEALYDLRRLEIFHNVDIPFIDLKGKPSW